MASIFCCGFECGVVGSTTHFSTLSERTFDTTTKRSGARSGKYTYTASGGSAGNVTVPNANVHVIRYYVYFETLPSVDMLFGIFDSSNETGVAYKASDGKLYAKANGALGSSGINVSTGSWYGIDLAINGAAQTCNAMVDGIAVGQASGNPNSSVSLSTGALHASSATTTFYLDDVKISSTSGDYPFGSGYVNHFVPTLDGTHNVASSADFQRGNTAVDITNATTTAWQLIDDVPLPSGAVDEADNQRAVAPPNATDYVECVFGPASGILTPIMPPRAVDVICVHHQIATTAGSMRVAVNDNGTVDDVLNLSGANGVTTYRYARKHYALAPTGGAWTVNSGAGNFNNLRSRFFSADANPDQCLDAIMIEAEFPHYKPRPPLNINQSVKRASTY